MMGRAALGIRRSRKTDLGGRRLSGLPASAQQVAVPPGMAMPVVPVAMSSGCVLVLGLREGPWEAVREAPSSLLQDACPPRPQRRDEGADSC